jgi:hypothetical protein
MKVLRGNDRGKSATLVQFSNDWIMVDMNGGTTAKIVTPTSVQVETDEERQRFESTKDNASVGMFWQWWELRENGTFARRKPS